MILTLILLLGRRIINQYRKCCIYSLFRILLETVPQTSTDETSINTKQKGVEERQKTQKNKKKQKKTKKIKIKFKKKKIN